MWFSGVSVLSAKTSYCQKWILNLFSVENVVEGFREKLVSARNIGKIVSAKSAWNRKNILGGG